MKQEALFSREREITRTAETKTPDAKGRRNINYSQTVGYLS
jgi:hypothetical protein